VEVVELSGTERQVCESQINELESKQNRHIIDLFRGINELKKVYKCRTRLKHENCELLADCHIFWIGKRITSVSC
jgi:hypothetical protein